MQRHWVGRAIGLFVSLGFLSIAEGQGEAYRRVHDPVLIREKNVYYVFSTGNGVPIRRSKDLRNWELVGRVFKEDVPAWAKAEIPKTKHVWAPDIACYRGQYLLFYAVSTMGSQRSCIGLAINKTLDRTSPQYRWVDQGKVIESFPDQMDYNAIDPNFVTDADGKPYLVWGSFWGGIKMMELDPETCKPRPEDQKIYSLAARPEAFSIEAPFLIHKNGWYYLFVSLEQCCRGVASNYRLAVGRAKEITGPYVDYVGRPMLQGFTTRLLEGYGTCRGPGHNGVLLGADGDWLIHHMYDATCKGMPTMQIRPLIFAEDGWPLVGEPLTEQAATSKKLGSDALIGTWIHTVNFGAGDYIQLKAQGKINSTSDPANWTYESGRLLLHWTRLDTPDRPWYDTCYLLGDGHFYVGRNPNGDLVRGVRQPE